MKLNWSRRELEAFGEPLGDSVTQRKLGGGYICGGGGGKGGGGGGAPAPAPTQTTAYNTNIPEYARPYVQSMLGATQKQLFETSDGQITGFKPYTPYSTDPTAYVAPFSPQQEQAFKGVANLQQPGQFAPATGLAAASGLGSLGIAGQAAGTGADYYSLATSPEAMGAFMSPYMQNAVDRQKFEATRDYAKQLQAQKAQAVGAGAFGGSRQAIVESEAQRNLNQQLQNIQAAGTQQAFQQAQQAQQFGAGLGLQGLQASLQGLGQAGQAAGTLGQLGTAQQATDLDRLRSQQQMGALQQQRQQDIINQAVQNYAIQQQYPLMQLGFMSNMLRGLPLQSQTTQLYQAQPTTTQQAIGLLGAGASLFGKAGGGAIKEYREGGIASAAPGYKYGTLISEPKLEAMADDLTVEQLQARLRDPALTPGERQIFQEALAEKMQQEKARVSGIAMAGGPAFESQGMAGGGIVAFSDGGLGMINPEFGGGDQTMDRLRIEQLQLQKDIDQYNFLKDASPVAAERMLASNPMLRDKVSPAPAPAPVAAAKPPAPKEEI
jgi:hypothetical protein